MTTLCSMFALRVYGQGNTHLGDSLQHQLNLYRQSNPSSLLFVHFDKTLYTNNDNVWFTAYLLNAEDKQEHHTLSVSLVNDVDRVIALEEKFVMVNGIGLGNLFIPDSISPGNYTFNVYTNIIINKAPEVLFSQPVTIKSTSVPGFKAILSLTDTAKNSYHKPRQVLLNVNGNDYLPLANASVDYKVLGNDTTTINGKGKTSKAGQYIIQVPSNKNMVQVQVKSKNNAQYLHLYLPQSEGQPKVKFYPEGGSLVNNLVSQVGVEVKTSDGRPLKISGLLYNYNTVIDTIETDSYGMGRFIINPQTAAKYWVKLNTTGLKDTAYQLPAVLPNGITLTMHKAIVNDTLHLQLKSSQHNTVYLNVHNYQQQFISTAIEVNALSARKVKVSLNNIPKGLAVITLTDSLGKPYAERIFFAHYNERDLLKIKTDKNTYHTREKVKLSMQMLSQNGQPLQGAVSIACVQDNRLELKKTNDIESYFYLKSVLGEMPLKENYLSNSNDDKNYLEKLLLIKGWRNYSWLNLISQKAIDTLYKNSSLEFSGKINQFGKQTKKPVDFMLIRDSLSALLITDEAGKFILAHTDMVNPQDKPLKIFINAAKGYDLTMTNPYQKVNLLLANVLKPVNYEGTSTSQNSENFAIKGMERAIQLREVKVSSSKDNSLYGAKQSAKFINSCGDYICRNNIFNCANHRNEPDNTQPVIGATYIGKVYLGCGGVPPAEASNIRSLPAIYQAKQFYGADYAVVNPCQPEYLSTIYWNHLVNVNADKEVELYFYTSDITGKFRIIVQGITTSGVVYSESNITVKKP
ncbi:hypothetical protein ACFQ3S_07780 [Mucilaginibacter terrae]